MSLKIVESQRYEGGFVYSPIEPVTPAAVKVNLRCYARGAAFELKACYKIETKKTNMQKAHQYRIAQE